MVTVAGPVGRFVKTRFGCPGIGFGGSSTGSAAMQQLSPVCERKTTRPMLQMSGRIDGPPPGVRVGSGVPFGVAVAVVDGVALPAGVDVTVGVRCEPPPPD